MKKIKLTQRQVALVDDADYDWLNQWKWYAKYNKCTDSFYAVRKIKTLNGRRAYPMHRQILELEYGDKRHIDHISHDTLDNRRSNIRICSRSQNGGNRRRNKNSPSKYKGIHPEKSKRWSAQIGYCGNKIHLGTFSTEKEAAIAYNEAAKKYFGEFACLNQIS